MSAAPAPVLPAELQIFLLLQTNGIEFQGIQHGFGIVLDLVLFAGPGGTTLAVDVEAFRNPQYAIALCKQRIWQAEVKSQKAKGEIHENRVVGSS